VTDVVTERESPAATVFREWVDAYRADIERWCPVPGTADPWTDWLTGLRFPRGPLDAWLEHDVEEMIVAADRRRLATVPTTKHFAATWAEFRQQHEYLEHTAHRRCVRYLIWRGAALKVKLELDRFQDVIDRNQCRAKLTAAERSIGGSNIDDWLWSAPYLPWQDGSRQPHPLSAYAATVLALVKSEAVR
jgi:hypothetical protein